MPNDTSDIRRAIHDYVVSNFLFGTADVDDGNSLVQQGILDSMGVLELVLFVEEQLGVTVSDSEVLPQHFDSVNSLAAFVASKKAVGADIEAPSMRRPVA